MRHGIKQGMDKRAVLEPAWGALGGSIVAPTGRKNEGALRGAGMGVISALGGLGTGAIGYHLAKDRVPGTVNIAGYDVPKAALIGLLSSLPGNLAGYGIGKKLFWPDRWEDPEKEVKRRAKGMVGLNSKEGK
jgi:hypothetical protein